MKLRDITRFTRPAYYRVNVSWGSLESTIRNWMYRGGVANLELDPDFQRGHIWTEDQQVAYVEFKLRDGPEANVILFNCVGWMNTFKGPFVLVDGLQRITAVRRFMANEIRAFGFYLDDFEDNSMILKGLSPDFVFAVNNLETRVEVLTWYLELNYRGTPHTQEELDKVRTLLEKEFKKGSK